MTTNLLDRVVRWNLDLGGDSYGDERERYRWYEGIAGAAQTQWLAVPWACAIMVWPLGRPAVLPLAVVLVLIFVPMMLCTFYVRRHRVDTVPRSWNAKRVVLGVLGGTPFAFFLVGALHAYDPEGSMWSGAAFGVVFGAVAGMAGQMVETRRRRRREAAVIADED